jgi:hypothetical protein
MSQRLKGLKDGAEATVRDIQRRTRKQYMPPIGSHCPEATFSLICVKSAGSSVSRNA